MKKTDRTGLIYGPYRVIGNDESRPGRWISRCTRCGSERSFTVDGLRAVKSQGKQNCIRCKKSPEIRPVKIVDHGPLRFEYDTPEGLMMQRMICGGLMIKA